jgi:hypothetical protein
LTKEQKVNIVNAGVFEEMTMKKIIDDVVALGTLMALTYVILVWGTIGEALAGL